MTTILISGSASGIGREFLRTYCQSKSNTIIAVDRTETETDSLNAAAKVESYCVDVTSPSDIKKLAEGLAGVPIDILIHSVGIRGLVPAVEKTCQGDVAGAETLYVMDMETMMKTFQVNSAGTFLLVQGLLPNLQASARASPSPPKVVIMTSRMGSIASNTTGGAYAYRASKAAVNAMVKSLSLDVPEVIFALVHPGRVETGLVKFVEKGAIGVGDAVRDLQILIESLSSESSGEFVDRFGKPIAW